MNSKRKYYEHMKRIEALYPNLYLADPCVDAENCGIKDESWETEEFWAAMYRSFHNSVGQRMFENGFTQKQVKDAEIDY